MMTDRLEKGKMCFRNAETGTVYLESIHRGKIPEGRRKEEETE